MRRLIPPLLAAAVCGCAGSIDPGPQIGDITEDKERPASDRLPVVETPKVGPDTEQALENYRKLLDLPQDPVTRAETLRRLADLQLEMDEAGGGSFEQSELRLNQSVALYNTLLAEYPDDPRNDRVLYQLSRAYQNLGQLEQAEATLLRLTEKYPDSVYSDEAHFRHAELLFRLGDFEEAEREYRYVIDRPSATAFSEPARYKYGWSLYKQSKFEQAAGTFLDILQRELPAGELVEPEAALAGVAAGKRDLAKDALRVVSLSLAALGGGDAANRLFRSRAEPAFAPMIYVALGELLLEKQRFTDAAGTYDAFIRAHPRHALAPSFRSRAVDAQQAGGFTDLVVTEKERYVADYDPSAPYWSGRTPPPDVMQALRRHLEDLATHYQARGQKARDAGQPTAKADFVAAAKSYRRLLELFPQDPKAAELRFLLGESLFESGSTLAAADEYNRVVKDYPAYTRAPEAAYAAVLAYQRHAREVPPQQKKPALQKSVQAALQLAERYPKHPQALAAVTRAAEDLYELESWDEAIAAAARVLNATPPAPAELRRTAWGITADTHFGQKRFAQAETAYTELLKLTPPDAKDRKALEERLAASVYKQGEAARDAGDLRAAVDAFLRVGRVAPAAAIRANAEYDAAAALITLKDWTQAARVLEAFRVTHLSSPLLADVDKKLAVVYQNSGRPADAAFALRRVADRGGESPDTRRDAVWLSATLLDKANNPRAVTEYEAYLKQYPRPLDRALEARKRLAELALARGDSAQHQRWLRDIVAADAAAAEARTTESRVYAAEAALELGRIEARNANQVSLRLPLQNSLPAKKKAMERAISTLTQAADYGIAEVTTAAAYEMGVLYQRFSRALLDSERPARLSDLEREQYDLLLEEQAYPFEERAIEWHESNLGRVSQGVYNEWVEKSVVALTEMAPARYGKQEQAADFYDDLR